MPAFVPSSFSSTINESSVMNRFDFAFAQAFVVIRPSGAEQYFT
jgi:hypothetical protein